MLKDWTSGRSLPYKTLLSSPPPLPPPPPPPGSKACYDFALSKNTNTSNSRMTNFPVNEVVFMQ